MSTLDTPLSLRCGRVLAHRVALAPLTNLQSNADGTLHDDELQWLRRRAGHFALISTCAAFVSEEGKAWSGQLGAARPEHEPGLSTLAAAIERTGSAGIVQLHHGGAKASLAPQRLSTEDAQGVRGATEADLERVVGDFVAAALRSERAGFAGVEIHGANGYLFTQFLAPHDNPRVDGYGGDLVGRARLLRETVRAVRAATSDTFMVGVRISPVDVWMVRGLVLEDGVQLAAWLDQDGVDFVHLSLSDASGPAPHGDPDVAVTTAVREGLGPDVALFVAGGMWTREDAHQTRAAGADVVVLGRSAIAHPDWPSASAEAGFVPKRPPWDPQHLRSVAVGPGLLEYLNGFSGMVVGGKPAR